MRKLTIILVLGLLLASSLVTAGLWDRITGRPVAQSTVIQTPSPIKIVQTISCKLIDVPSNILNAPAKTANNLCQNNNAGRCALQIKSKNRRYYNSGHSCDLQSQEEAISIMFESDTESISKCEGKLKKNIGDCLTNRPAFGTSGSYQDIITDAKVLCCKIA
ncbi:MAG: hypothetical protein AABY09_03730 [Nanoarchaeota archaeon]